jgi:hypothetical protein
MTPRIPGDTTAWLGRQDSNLCISESEFGQTLSPGRQD